MHRVVDGAGALQTRGGVATKFEIGKNRTATVTILDDDHRGNFSFEETNMSIDEGIGCVNISVRLFKRLPMLTSLLGCSKIWCPRRSLCSIPNGSRHC